MAHGHDDNDDAHELLTPNQKVETGRNQRTGLLSFFGKNPTVPAALVVGAGGAIACFCFALWLSRQVFECPDWALWCSVRPSVAWILARFQQVQGITSAVYGIFVSAVAYGTYQLAQTTIWALLARRALTFKAIDDYLAASQGSIPSAPFALFQARTTQHLLVMVVVVSISILLKVNPIIVGHAFSMPNVPTILYSNQTLGGGTGMRFIQEQPVRTLPGAALSAYSNYYAWAEGYASEPMPDHRNLSVNRRSLAKIGQVSVGAVEATTSMSCDVLPMELTGEIIKAYGDLQWKVNTSDFGALRVRLQPFLSVWGDTATEINATSAVTKIVFAAINGTIEGGYDNIPPKDSPMDKKQFLSISTLACDVAVNLFESHLCTFSRPDACLSPNVTLTNATNLVPKSERPFGPFLRHAKWMGAVIETYGISISAAQPLFELGPTITSRNESIRLPIPYTSTLDTFGNSPQWSRAQLMDFIQVGSGAYAMATSQAFFPSGRAVLESVYSMKRMSTNRVYLLLLPPALTVGSVVLLSLLVATLHAATNVPSVRLGDSASFIVSSQTADIREMVDDARQAGTAEAAVSEQHVRFSVTPEGTAGLARGSKVGGM